MIFFFLLLLISQPYIHTSEVKNSELLILYAKKKRIEERMQVFRKRMNNSDLNMNKSKQFHCLQNEYEKIQEQIQVVVQTQPPI